MSDPILLPDVLAGVKELLRNIERRDEEDCREEIPILSSRVCIEGKKEEVELSKTIVLKVLKCAIDKTDDPSDDEKVRKAVEQFFADLETKNAIPESAERGSIILNIRCRSLTGLENMLTLFKIDGRSFRLVGIENALSELYQDNIKVTLVLPDETLERFADWIDAQLSDVPRSSSEEFKHKRKLNLGIRCESAASALQVIQYFQSGDAANRLNQLSEALSEALGDTIKIDATLDLEGFQEALLHSMATSPSLSAFGHPELHALEQRSPSPGSAGSTGSSGSPRLSLSTSSLGSPGLAGPQESRGSPQLSRSTFLPTIQYKTSLPAIWSTGLAGPPEARRSPQLSRSTSLPTSQHKTSLPGSHTEKKSGGIFRKLRNMFSWKKRPDEDSSVMPSSRGKDDDITEEESHLMSNIQEKAQATIRRFDGACPQYMDPYDVIDLFVKSDCFEESMNATVKSIQEFKNPIDKYLAFCDTIFPDPKKYKEFKRCLGRAGQWFFLYELDEIEENVHTEMKDNGHRCTIDGTILTCKTMSPLKLKPSEHLSPRVRDNLGITSSGSFERRLDYTYDAFISYSYEDGDEVGHDCIEHLEGAKEGLKLCVGIRDFLPGRMIADCIAEGMFLSEKIVMFISKEFLNSRWCIHEYNVALEAVMQGRCFGLIIVLLEKGLTLPSNFRRYSKASCIDYPEKGRTHEIAVFWKRLDKTIRKK